MLHNHIKTAFRRLLRNKAVSAINIAGLTLGMAVTFVILIYVSHEFSYDDFQAKKDRIYRVTVEKKLHQWKTASTPYPLADKLENDYPEVIRATRVGILFGTQVQKDQRYLEEKHFVCVDGDFPEIFTLEVLRGNPDHLVDDPQDVVLTESMARKYYGTLEVVGKELNIQSGGEELVFDISGVIRDLPETSTLKIRFLASSELYLNQIGKTGVTNTSEPLTADRIRGSWEMDLFLTYLLVNEGFQPAAFENHLEELQKSVLEEPEKQAYHLQAMEDIYFHSGDLLSSFTVSGHLKEVYIFSVVAFLILLVACINYILLSSSQALDRSREVGIRKITGATRKNLFRQLLVESLLITIIAFPLALILIEQLRPVLIRFLEKDFLQYGMLGWEVILGFALVLFTLTYFPGLFIVRYYARISPALVMAGKRKESSRGPGLRKALMAVQFSIFLILVSCSMGIFKQLHYAKNQDLGFDPEGILTFSLGNRPDTQDEFSTLKKELLKNPHIQSVGGSMWVLPTNNTMSYDVSMPENPEESVSINALLVDRDFPRTMGIGVVQGKPFSAFSEKKEDMVLINEQAQKKLEMEDPIGKRLAGCEIVGVVNDFHHNSFRHQIAPMMLISKPRMARNMVVKVSGRPDKQVLDYIESTYRSVIGASAFNYTFLTEQFNQLYKRERKLGSLLSVLSAIAIIISSMGLLGLTIFQTRKRTKEIAIRKVNGARIGHMMGLLSGNYLKMIFFSALVAMPLSYWIMKQWLRNFAYQTSLSWWIFIGSVMLAVVITLFTVSFQTYRAATANPAESLRYE